MPKHARGAAANLATVVSLAVALVLPMVAPPGPAAHGATSAAKGRTPTVGGCPVFPGDNPWNRDIRKLPVRTESGRWLASINAAGAKFLHPDFGSDPSFGIPYSVVPAGQKTVAVAFDEAAEESDAGPYPLPANPLIEGGDDRHVIVVQQGSCRLFELFNARRQGSAWTAGSGAVFDLTSNRVRPKGWTSADAAGLPILPGLVRYDEIARGEIRHALRVTFPATQNGFIFPARNHAGQDNPALPPMGARLLLKASFDVSPFTGQARVILDAQKSYGLIVADNGSSWFISGAPDPRWNDDDLAQLKQVPGSAYEFVGTERIER